MHNQEAAVQWTFQLERNSFFYLSALTVQTQCSSLHFAHSCTKHVHVYTLTLALHK